MPGTSSPFPFPFSDLSAAKRRPALLLTYPNPDGDCVACSITSRGARPHARLLTPDMMAEGALPLVSWIRANKAFSLHTGLVVRRFGRVTETCRTEIVNELCRYLRLAGRSDPASSGQP